MRGRCYILIALLLSSLVLSAQEPDISRLLDSSRNQLMQIESYQVAANFKVDVAFINMPDKKATIKFETPDKFEVESDGFLMIPKMGMRPMTKNLNLDNYLPVYLGIEEINGQSCHVVKMLPKKKKSKIVLSTICLGVDDLLVRRWEVFTKKAGNVVVDFSYANEILPSEMIFSFEISGMNIPVKYFGSEVEIDKQSFEDQEVQEGKLIVTFENYQIKMKEE